MHGVGREAPGGTAFILAMPSVRPMPTTSIDIAPSPGSTAAFTERRTHWDAAAELLSRSRCLPFRRGQYGRGGIAALLKTYGPTPEAPIASATAVATKPASSSFVFVGFANVVPNSSARVRVRRWATSMLRPKHRGLPPVSERPPRCRCEERCVLRSPALSARGTPCLPRPNPGRLPLRF